MNELKATRYQRLTRWAHAAGIAAGGVMLALMSATPAAGWLAAWARAAARGLGGPAHAAVALTGFVTLTVAAWELVALPAVLYLGLSVDRRFRRAEHTVEELIFAQVHATLVTLPAALAVAGVVRAAAWLAGDWWWLLSGVALAVGLAGALHAAPLLLVFLGDAQPVDRLRPELVTRLSRLAREARVPLARVDGWRIDESARTVALLTGVGRARRVLISSHILRDWSDDEIAVVVGHELAHHARHDLWRTLALDAAVFSAALWIASTAGRWGGMAAPVDLAALPFLALVAGLVWLLATPLRHAQSRAHEEQADRFALSLTGGADAFGAAIRRLGARHLVEEEPSTLTRWLYHRHPSMAERLALAEAFARATPERPPGAFLRDS